MLADASSFAAITDWLRELDEQAGYDAGSVGVHRRVLRCGGGCYAASLAGWWDDRSGLDRAGRLCRLSPDQLLRLRAELDLGPAEHGWVEDQRWTLARIATVIGRLFHISYIPRGVSYLLHRMAYSPQVPKHRATQRDEEKIAQWRATTWAKVRG